MVGITFAIFVWIFSSAKTVNAREQIILSRDRKPRNKMIFNHAFWL
jgi:hypothetical protein